MQYNEDKRIKINVPFLQDRIVLYIDSSIGTSHFYIEDHQDDILSKFKRAGYKFLFIPSLCSRLSHELIHYLYPGNKDILFVEDMYQRIQDLADLNDRTGFLYKLDGQTYFREIPEAPYDEIEAAVKDLVDFLNEQQEKERGRIRFRMGNDSGVRFRIMSTEDSMVSTEDSMVSTEEPFASIEGSVVYLEEPLVSTKKYLACPEEPLDPKTQRIIEAWEKIEREFGITIDDLDIILGYRVKLSHLHITTSGKIILSDLNGGKEVKMDDLTKALYFFYLHHPEGVALKELQTYENEILHHYMTITGRDDPKVIKNSIDTLLNPFSNNLNVSLSRIKKAFKDVVGDRVAKFYYVDGRYAEPRKVAIDRDLVIWDH